MVRACYELDFFLHLLSRRRLLLLLPRRGEGVGLGWAGLAGPGSLPCARFRRGAARDSCCQRKRRRLRLELADCLLGT